MDNYDIIVGGGGFAGSSLALALAGRGLKILIVEPQEAFLDRVRGEGVAPWGVAELAKIGIDSILLSSCAREVKKYREMFGGVIVATRHLDEAVHGRGFLCFEHVKMQTCLLDAAAASGADVLRGYSIVGLERGTQPAEPITVAITGAEQRTLTARLVVGADGRASRIASLAGFVHRRGESRTCTSGVMLRDFWGPTDTVQHSHIPDRGLGAITFPLDHHGLARAYFCARRGSETKMLRGPEQLPAFFGASLSAGMNAASFAEATAVGPLFTYDGTHMWVDEPYLNAVVLVGDAASTSDPAFGNGLALAARDVRELRDQICTQRSFDAAGRSYGRSHRVYYHAVRRIEDWFTDLLYDTGDGAEQLRQRAMPLHRLDSTRVPDLLGLGPEAPSDELAGMRFLGLA
jgi:2-polyprenyl-6-methoxyphenol hydroxylase-like FAD-dependent oxidoreductase